MAQDLNRMMSIFINGVEEVRKINSYVFGQPGNVILPIPIMIESEYLVFTNAGIAVIIDKSCVIEEGNC